MISRNKKFFPCIVFNTTEYYPHNHGDEYFGPQSGKNGTFENPHPNMTETCRYRGFRTNNENNEEWLYVFTARLCFIVVFEVSTIQNSEPRQ